MADYKLFTELELVDKLRAGDDMAFEQIYDMYKMPLFSYAFSRLEDREEVRDLIHELFMYLWAYRGELTDGSLRAFLFVVLRRRILDQISRRRVVKRYVDGFLAYKQVAEDTTDHLVRQREMKSILENHIAALPKKMREVFELSRKTNYSRKEIAVQLGLSEETVKSHMQRALKILKVKLGPFLSMLLL